MKSMVAIAGIVLGMLILFGSLNSVLANTTIGPATGASMTFSVASPQVNGTTIRLQGFGAGGTGKYEYSYYLRPSGGDWRLLRGWSTTSTHDWDTSGLAGTYTVQVVVRNQGSTAAVEAYGNYPYTFTGPATGAGMTFSEACHLTAGTTVTLQGFGAGGTGVYEYMYYLKPTNGDWQLLRGWSTTSTFDATGYNAGTYTVQVVVRNQGSTAPYEAYTNYQYTIVGGCTPPVLLGSKIVVGENQSAGEVAGFLSIKSSGDSNVVAVKLEGNGAELFEASLDGIVTLKSDAGLFPVREFTLSAYAVNAAGASDRVTVGVVVAKVKQDAWYDLQTAIDNVTVGGIVQLEPNTIYVLNSTVDLRNYHDLTIDGNGSVIKRANAEETSTFLKYDYDGSLTIYVNSVPLNYKVGDYIAISRGVSISDVTIDAKKITAINGDIITIDTPFTSGWVAGDTVFKTFYLISGLPSNIEGGSNPGIVLKNIIFDGNSRGNKINYGWIFNACIGLHGGKTSEIFDNVFLDMPNETIIGHGVAVHNNVFNGLNGSAFHTSVHDKTLALNGLAAFFNNIVIKPNRIEKGLNGHSEGAITFSWGGGNLSVKDNYFYSSTGNYGMLGVFAGSYENTDENLVVTGNFAQNFDYIIRIISPVETPTRNILITNNNFRNAGINDFLHLKGNTSIRLGCNYLTGYTSMTFDSSNAGCE